MRHTCHVLFALTLLLACSEPRTAPKSDGRDAASGATVRVVFSLSGDDIGSPESSAVLQRLGAAVAARGSGEVAGSGFGMGRMELVVRLRGEGSRAALEAIIREEYPAARYRVEEAGP